MRYHPDMRPPAKEHTSLAILYEDPDLIVIDKPPGLAVVPEAVPGDTVIRRLTARMSQKIYVVHRLDKDTSGVLLLAKNPLAHRQLNEQFSDRRVQKTYYALVHGIITPDRGRINAAIRQFGSGRMAVDRRRGKPSRTEFRVLKRFCAFTLIEVSPLTGRRHQLRVHCYHIGHPIAGDRTYGERSRQNIVPRLMLHAGSLTFHLPSGPMRTVSAPLPPSFLQAQDTLRRMKKPGP